MVVRFGTDSVSVFVSFIAVKWCEKWGGNEFGLSIVLGLAWYLHKDFLQSLVRVSSKSRKVLMNWYIFTKKCIERIIDRDEDLFWGERAHSGTVAVQLVVATGRKIQAKVKYTFYHLPV